MCVCPNLWLLIRCAQVIDCESLRLAYDRLHTAWNVLDCLCVVFCCCMMDFTCQRCARCTIDGFPTEFYHIHSTNTRVCNVSISSVLTLPLLRLSLSFYHCSLSLLLSFHLTLVPPVLVTMPDYVLDYYVLLYISVKYTNPWWFVRHRIGPAQLMVTSTTTSTKHTTVSFKMKIHIGLHTSLSFKLAIQQAFTNFGLSVNMQF